MTRNARTGGYRRQWRFYETVAGNKPVRKFLDELPPADAAEIVTALRDVAHRGLSAARHLRAELWEVRVHCDRRAYRVLFSPVGRYKQVLLALEGFSKKTRKTPPHLIQLAMRRLSEWQGRGEQRHKNR